EEIPVSMSGSGSGTVYPLATVDAGDGAIILVSGTMDTPSAATTRPHLAIGTYTHASPHTDRTGAAETGIGTVVTGTVEVSILLRSALTSSFTGTVYVAHLRHSPLFSPGHLPGVSSFQENTMRIYVLDGAGTHGRHDNSVIAGGVDRLEGTLIRK